MARRLFLSVAVVVIAVLSLSSPGMAQSIYWNGNGGTNLGSWNTAADWWTTPGGTTTVGSFSGAAIIANFNATSVTSPQTITLDANQVVQGLIFTGTDTGGETINNGGGTNTLTIGASGIVDNAASGSDAINANLLLSAAQTWTNNSANTLTIAGNAQLTPAIVAATTLTVSGSGASLLSGSLSTGGGAGASLALTYNGTGSLTLSGSNTYAGATTLANVSGLETLQLSFSAAGAPANNIVNNSVTITNNAITTGSALSVGGGTLRVVGSAAPSATNSQAFNGTTVTAGQTVIAFNGTAGNTINLDLGAITRTAAGGLVNFTQPSTGTANIYTTTANPAFTGGSNTILGGWALFTPSGSASPTTWATSAGVPATAGLVSGLSSYAVANGSTAITAGADIDVQASPATVATITVNSLRFNTAAPVTITGTAANTITVASAGILETSAVGTNAVTITGGSLTTGNGADLIVNQYNAASPLTISAAVTGTTGLTLSGGGTLVLAGANTYTGGTRLNAGTLQLGDGVTNNGTTTYSGVISGSGRVVVSGAGTFAFGAQNSYTGNLTVNGGTVTTGTGSGGGNSAFGAVNASRTITINAGATLNSTINNFLVGAGSSAAVLPTITINGGTMSSTRYNAIGNLNLNSGATLVQSATDAGAYNGYQFLGTVTVGGTSASTISTTNGKADHLLPAGITFNVGVTGATGGDLIVSAPLANDSGDYGNGTASSLIKTGSGVMLLSGANTYSGPTLINAGTLLVSNSLALQNSAVTLSALNDLQFAPLAAPSAGYYAVGGLNGGVNVAITNTSGGSFILLVGGINTTSIYNGVLSGVGSGLAKTGSGVFTLSNSNTYTNGTIVSAGTLVAGNGLASLGAGPVTVSSGATLSDGLAIDQTFVNAVQNSTNSLVLALGANSSNNLDFSASGANLANASLGATGAFAYSGTLTPFGGVYRLGGGGGTLTYTGSLAGSGSSLVKTGTGSTLALTTAASLTGPVTLAQGIINLNSTATFLNSSGITIVGNSGETVTSAAPFGTGNINLSGPTLFLNDGSGTTDHFGTTPVTMNGGSIELLSSGSSTIQNLTISTQGQIVSAPSAGAGSATNITNLALGSNASATFQSQNGPIGSGTTNVGQIYITNLTQNANPIALNGGTTTMLGAGLTVQTPSNQGGDGHTYFAAYGANGVTQLTGTTTTIGAGGNVVDLGESPAIAGSPFTVNSLVTQTADLTLPNGATLLVTSGGVVYGGNAHWIKAPSTNTANITGGMFANNYTFYVTTNNGGTDGTNNDFEFNNVRLTDNGGNPVTFVKAGSGTFAIGQSGTGGVGTATYTGPTIINGGVLRTNIGGSLGTLNGTPSITVNAGGTLMGGAGDSFGFTANIDVITLNDGTITESSGTIRQTLWNIVTMNGGTITAPAGTGNAGNYSIDAGITATSDAAGNPAVINAAQIGLQNGNGGGTANPFNVSRGPGAIDLLISSVITSFTAGNGLSFNGNGVTVLTGNSTYTGVTNITGGTVRVGNGANSGSLGTGAVTDNGALVYNRLDNFTVANNISGSGALTQAGAGTLTLTAALASFTGQTNIDSGTLRLGDGVTTTGNMVQGSSIVDNGALIISYPSPDNQIYNGTISGTGSVTKSGTSSLTLTSAQAYTGATTISAGSLVLPNSNAGLANTAITVAAGASFSVHPGGNSITIGSTATSSAGASLALAAGTGANAGAAFDMVDGNIGTLNLQQGSGFGNGISLGGAGTSANAPSLSFEIGNVLGSIDTLAVSNGVFVGASGAKIVIAGLPGATSLATGDYTFITATGGLGGSGFTLASTILNVGSHSYVLSLTDSTATSEVLTITNSTIPPPTIAYWTGKQSSLWGTFTGVSTINTNWATDATGAADTQQLPGPLTNVFFTVTSGALNLSNSLGQDFSINSLNFTGAGTSATNPVTISGNNALTINAAAVNGNTAGSGITVAAGSGAHTIASNVILGASQTWTNSSTNLLTVSGNIGDGGNAFVLTTAGQISLSGVNTYSGGTVISSGVLTINGDAALGAIPISAQTNLTFAANGTLRASGAANLVANRNILIGSGVTATFDTNGNAVAIAGAINDADATGIVAKIGNGALTLSGSSAYGGGTTVTAGTLRAGAGGGATVFGASGSSVTIASGATLDYNGIPLNGSVVPDYSVFVSGTGVGGLGALVDNGPANDSSVRLMTLTGDTTIGGTARWGMRSSTNGAATLTGGGFNLTKIGTADFVIAQGAGGNPTLATGLANININAGRIVVADTATVDNVSAGSIFVNTTGSLDVGNYTGTVTILKPIVMAGGSIVTDATGANGNSTIAAPISLNATGLFNPQATSTLTLAGNITDGTASNGITVNAAGTVVLTGANSYSGLTTISAGTLQIDNGGTTGSLGTANVVNNAALVFNRGDDTYTVPNAISGTGGVTHAGPGNLVLTGNLSYTGPTTIATGVLTLANPTNDETLSGAIGGTGAIVKSAAKMVTLLSGNAYTGGTTINQGTVAIGNNTALGTGNVNLAGGRLQLQAGTGVLTGRSIGINFEGGQNAGTTGATSLLATDSAGFVPQINWNNLSSTTTVVVSNSIPGGNANIDATSPVSGSIVDNSGQVVAGATISFLSNNPWAVSGTVPTGGDAKLMNGYLDLNQGGGTTTSVTVSNLPFQHYSVYAYVGSDGNGRVGHGTIGGTSFYFSTNDNPFGGYVQATATTQAAAVSSTYLLFQNLAGSSVTYTQNGDTNNVGLHGLQILEVGNGPLTLANNLVVTADSTIDVTGFNVANVTGSLAIGANTLSVTGGSTGANVPYTLALGATNLSGNATFNVANNGTGTGALTMGAVDDGGAGFGIIKTGNGTLALISPNGSTYTAATNVNSGTLLVANASGSAVGSAPVTVGSAGTLGVSAVFGTGSISGAVSVNGGGVTSASIGNQSSASLTLSNGLSLAAGSKSSFSLNGIGVNNTTNSDALVYVSGGALSVAGPTTVAISGSPAIGVYDLYGYIAGPTSISNFTTPAAPPGYAWSLAVSSDGSGIGSSNPSANQLDLVVTKVPLTWNGATNGAWDTTTQNWAMGLPGIATTYSDNNAVFFGDRDPISGNLVTNTAVTIQASGVTPASVTFTNTGAANGGVDYSVSGKIILPAGASLSKSGAGTATLTGALSLGNNSSLAVGGGTLRLSVTTGSATIGTSISATVSAAATLELAGTVSALSSTATAASRVNVTNNSKQSSGGSLLVSGTNQQVGAISGTGDTVVMAGANLTANSIVQNALVIGGDMTHAGLVTIGASDASGNPLATSGGLALAGSLASSVSFASGTLSSSSPLAGGSSVSGSAIASDSGSSAIGGVNLGGSNAVVPEPSTLLLLLLGSLACFLPALRRRRKL
jgi:fibronectin-binding autotransporter adhesin